MHKTKKLILKHKNIEEVLTKSFKQLRDIKFALDESAIVAITDQTGKITFVNDKFCKISQYSKDELLGQDHRLVNSGYHPKEFMQDLWRTITQGKVWRGEIKNQAKDGTFYWVDTTIVPFLNDAGKPYQYVVIHHEITQQKVAEEAISASEEKFKDFFENAPIGFQILNKDQKFIDINKAGLEMLGYKKDEIVGKRRWEDLTIPEMKMQCRQDWDCLLKYGEIRDKEYILLHKSGRPIHVLCNATAKFDKLGQFINTRGSMIDITEKKMIEEAINELPQKIITAQESAQKLIAQEIHDDFGQQLIALKIFLVNHTMDLIEKYPELKPLSDGLKEKINAVIEKARNLSHQLAPPDFKYFGLVKAVKELVQSINLEKDLSINFLHRNLKNIDFETKDIIIYRIIQESLSNIVKHAEAKNVEISLRHKQGKVYLRIKDDGKGFDLKQHGRSSKSLGLSVMRERAKLAGGLLQIKSAPSAGTHIHLSIPVKSAYPAGREKTNGQK